MFCVLSHLAARETSLVVSLRSLLRNLRLTPSCRCRLAAQVGTRGTKSSTQHACAKGFQAADCLGRGAGACPSRSALQISRLVRVAGGARFALRRHIGGQLGSVAVVRRVPQRDFVLVREGL